MWEEDRLLIAANDMVAREDRFGGALNVQDAQAHLQQYQQFMIDGAQVNRAERALPGVPAPQAPQAPPGPPPPHGTRGEVLNMEAAERIHLQTECQHDDWYPVGIERGLPDRIGQACERCRMPLARYLLECRNCKLRVCVRCRRNRLRG